jgi:iron-sulfur cluster repair protein YtfE (RIC family)
MSSTTTPAVTPRRDGEPEVDLTGYRLVHRAMLADTRAVADLADRVAGGSVVLTAARAAALREYVGELCHEIHTHHDAEDQIIWPVIAASAGAAVDLGELTDDHSVIDPMLARARTAATALATAPDDLEAACRLASAMTEMFTLLDEHIGEEEREVFPVITRFVSVGDYSRAEEELRRGVAFIHLRWVVAWLAHHATPAEASILLRKAGFPFRVLLAVSRPGFRRTRKAALGD